MKYEQEILAAYQRVGYTPRDRQVEHINEIIVAFNDRKIKNLVLSAPTGTGKSVIGVVVAEVMHELKFPRQQQHASFLLTATNALTEQYHESFGDGGRDQNFVLLKGASNYECSALTTPSEQYFGDTCTFQAFKKAGLDDMINRHCNNCEYRRTRQARINARHLVTNYSYFFTDRMAAANPLAPRTVTVFDEAHLLNDLFVEHLAIYFSEKAIQKIIDEVAEHLKLGSTDVFKDLKLIREGLIKGMINDETYPRFLEVLAECYTTIAKSAKGEADRNVSNHKAYTRFSRLAGKYNGLASKINDLFEYNYPSVFEYKKKDVAKGQNDHEASVKPIFVGEMFELLNNAEHNLLMSATITKEYAHQTLKMLDSMEYMRLDPQFPPMNKKVVIFKPLTLNYTSMKDQKTVKQLCANVWQIVDHHTSVGQRGIILAPSFNVVESITGTLRNMGTKAKIFEHRRGEKLAELVEMFKAYPIDKPAVLITPSGYEGVDLPGDLSRYQIIVKCPYASLGDRRIKVIMEQYPTIYQINAIQKIVQGAGRSVRSSDDWAITYMLDTAIQRVWQTGLNEWRSEFTTSFSSVLEHDEA